MSKKFTGVHSGGQNIPVYDKDAHSAIEQKLNTSAFQSVSGNFLTAVPEAYATKEYADNAANAAASGKLDTDTFSQVSGDFLTAVPQSYLQNTDLTVTSGKVTEISGIPLSAGGTLPDTIPVSGVSGISVTETENEVLIGISADFATSADLESKLDTSAFSAVSGNFLTAVPDDFATKEYLSSQISGKYDTSSFAEVSGNFLTAVPESAISGFATHEEVESAASGKMNVADMSAYQPSGDYYSASNPSGFLTEIPQSALSGYVHISASAVAIGTNAKTKNENAFAQGTRVSADRNSLAQGVNASAVQMAFAQGNNCIASSFSIAQGAGNRASEQSLAQGSYASANNCSLAQGEFVRADDHSIAQGIYASAYNRSQAFGIGTRASGNQMSIGEFNKTSAGAAFVIGNGSGSDELSDSFIIWKDGSVSAKGKISANGVELGGIPSGVMETSGLEYDGDKISGYMGSAFKAGDEFPQSATEAIEAVTANSGAWGGSALPISAGPGIKFEMNNGVLVASVTSTSGYVWQSASLFHTDSPVTQTTYTLSDSCSNYDKLEVDFYDINNWRTQMDCPIPPNLASSGTRGGYFSVVPENTTTTANVWFKAFNWTAANTTWTCYCSEIAAQGGSTTQTVNANQPDNPPKVINIIGWKRVGGN